MKYYKHPHLMYDENKIHRKLYKKLDKKDKRQYRKTKFLGNLGRFLFIFFMAVGMGGVIGLTTFMHPFAEGVFWSVLNKIIQVLFGVCSFIVVLILSCLVSIPLCNIKTKYHTAQKNILLYEATECLRKAYQLTEPCLVTKCYQCRNDEKFNLHDVCIFVTGDELRITTNLLHGFFNPENDLGCYILSRDEISLSKIPYNGTLATSLCCPDATFILGQRAYGFIVKQFLKSQGENSMSFRDVHLMKLQPSPFNAIKDGQKTLELRLNDGKRQKINPGDDIIFTQTETGEQMRVGVTALRRYLDFEAMYAAENPIAMGYKEGETADPKDMSQYYTEDEIKRYGTVAIEIKRIDI